MRPKRTRRTLKNQRPKKKFLRKRKRRLMMKFSKVKFMFSKKATKID
jgi:hypothetical protein